MNPWILVVDPVGILGIAFPRYPRNGRGGPDRNMVAGHEESMGLVSYVEA